MYTKVNSCIVGGDHIKIIKSKKACIILTLIMLFVFLFTILKDDTPKHRMQWWLSELNWDTHRTYSGKEIKIAIIDTGIDTTHKDLTNTTIEEFDIATDSAQKKKGSLSHGTAVAGIISAYPNNSKGVLGIAPKASIVSIDVTDNENGLVDPGILAKAIELSIEKHVDIINISVGTLTGKKELKEAVTHALDKGIIVIASAGNYMKNDVLYPAKYEGVIAVGSKTKLNNIISPSTEVKNKSIVYLPGDHIVTTVEGNSYFSAYGTSFSAAIMTGITALILEKNPVRFRKN